jgi:hypothetical protein
MPGVSLSHSFFLALLVSFAGPLNAGHLRRLIINGTDVEAFDEYFDAAIHQMSEDITNQSFFAPVNIDTENLLSVNSNIVINAAHGGYQHGGCPFHTFGG